MNQFFKTMDWLFPKHCLGCNDADDLSNHSVCDFCWNRLFHPQQIKFPHHPHCHVFSGGLYRDDLKKILVLAKFKHHLPSIEILNELLHQTFKCIPLRIDVITSVPSNYWRTVWRGVDLPATLAFDLAQRTKIPYKKNLLQKKRWVPRQTGLTQTQRSKNISGAFSAHPEIQGKTVLVVDDIMTTGSTAFACYRALKKQKPSRIAFLTAAKA